MLVRHLNLSSSTSATFSAKMATPPKGRMQRQHPLFRDNVIGVYPNRK